VTLARTRVELEVGLQMINESHHLRTAAAVPIRLSHRLGRRTPLAAPLVGHRHNPESPRPDVALAGRERQTILPLAVVGAELSPMGSPLTDLPLTARVNGRPFPPIQRVVAARAVALNRCRWP